MNGTDTDKNRGYELVVFDLDGTLVDDKLVIDNRDMESIQEARHRGMEITLATGRTFQSALPYIRELQIVVPVILCNGAAIVDPATEKILYQRKLSKGSAAFILEEARHTNLDCLLYRDPLTSCPCVGWLTPILRDYILLEGLHCAEVNDLQEVVHSCPPIKMQIVGDEDALLTVKKSYGRRFPQVSLLMTQKDYLEAMPAGVSKGAALVKLSTLLQVPLSKIVAFGDSVNDEELLALAGLGIAMAGAPEALKKAADATAPGVAAGLRRLLSMAGAVDTLDRG